MQVQQAGTQPAAAGEGNSKGRRLTARKLTIHTVKSHRRTRHRCTANSNSIRPAARSVESKRFIAPCTRPTRWAAHGTRAPTHAAPQHKQAARPAAGPAEPRTGDAHDDHGAQHVHRNLLKDRAQHQQREADQDAAEEVGQRRLGACTSEGAEDQRVPGVPGLFGVGAAGSFRPRILAAGGQGETVLGEQSAGRAPESLLTAEQEKEPVVE
jgi:hypothetical protein